jgi:GcrA cell cycle regulator
MQSTNWALEHCEALRENLAKGMAYSEIAKAINAKFDTAYSRNATISRARRMGLAGVARPTDASQPPLRVSRKMRQRYASLAGWIVPVFKREKTVKLRCVETDARHLSLLDLEPGDCRYPYGGEEEGEAITFCGRPCCEESSYCAPHFHLTRGPGTVSERAAGAVHSRLVEVA